MKKSTNTKKINGIIGRSSAKDIQRRHSLCIKLINENPSMSKEFFLKEYASLLGKNGLKTPTESTMLKDAKKCNIAFRNGTSQTSQYTMFNYLGSLLSPEIRQIRLTCQTHDDILLNINTYSYKISSLKSKAQKINAKLKKSISATDLLYLSFILKEKGIESYIEHVFDTEFSAPKDFLYIDVCCYCVKIYFQYNKYDIIMNKVFEIIEEFEPTE